MFTFKKRVAQLIKSVKAIKASPLISLLTFTQCYVIYNIFLNNSIQTVVKVNKFSSINSHKFVQEISDQNLYCYTT